ncbi:MAG: hypothetical protein ACOCXB_06660 [Halanaerobium sp.]
MLKIRSLILEKEKLNLTPIIKKVIKQQDNLLKEKNISLDLKLNREIYIIGLAVTKELMEAHQAEIKVESNGNGTLFKLIFKVLN